LRHATELTLDALEPLLIDLRELGGLTERRRGVFYRGSRAFLHFHEDRTGLFADVRLDVAWSRLEVTSKSQQRALLRQIRRAVG